MCLKAHSDLPKNSKRLFYLQVTLVLPAGVFTLGLYSFFHSGLITLNLTNSNISKIDNYTFEGTNLRDVEIPENAEISLGAYAFRNIATLTSFVNKGTITFSTGAYMFQNDEMLNKVVLGRGPTNIPGYMFQGCKSLNSIEIPDEITEIANYAFSGTGLETIEIKETSSLTTIGSQAFENTPLKSIYLPEGFTSLGNKAFANCTQMKYIILPSSIVQIMTSTSAEYTPFFGWTKGQHVFLKHSKFVALSLFGLSWCESNIDNVHYDYKEGDEQNISAS